MRPLRAVDLVLEFAWLAGTAIAVLLGAVLLWRALASAELTDAILRPARIMATITAAAMIAGLIATFTEAILLRKYAPAIIGAGWLTVISAGMLAASAMTGAPLIPRPFGN